MGDREQRTERQGLIRSDPGKPWEGFEQAVVVEWLSMESGEWAQEEEGGWAVVMAVENGAGMEVVIAGGEKWLPLGSVLEESWLDLQTN